MIIDTHTHFYDPSRPQGVPWPRPEETALYRTVLPEHYKALAVPLGVTGTIVVEASAWVEDNAWILELAANEPFIVGHVGNLTPGIPEFAGHLERFAANPLFRGIRTAWPNVSALLEANRLEDIERLSAHDLELDLTVGPDALPGITALAQRLPHLRIVLDHIAGGRIDGRAPNAAWCAGIRQVAMQPNVFCKVSALPEMTGQRPAPTDVAYYVPTLDVLWQAFGEDRLIYGSNWPVCEPFASYATVQHIVTAYFERQGTEASEKYFWKNSLIAYKWIRRDTAVAAG